MPETKHRNSLSQLNKLLPVPIELNSQQTEECSYNLSHITNVLVGDYHLIQGDIGKSYVSWAIRITLNDSSYSSIVIYRRYTDFEVFRNKLIKASGDHGVPELPPKDSFKINRLFMSNSWLDDRRKGLQWFLSSILLNPKYQHMGVINEFILGP